MSALAEAARVYLESSLVWIENEFGSIEGRVFDPNDSPDYAELAAQIAAFRDALATEEAA